MEEPTLDTFFGTLLHSWGGDTPSEAIWALGDFIKWVNVKYNLNLEAPDEDDYYADSNEEDMSVFDVKMRTIKLALANV